MKRAQTEHTDWCARNHTCGVVEHRSRPIVADDIGGRAVLTRVRAGAREYAEMTVRIPLHHTAVGSSWQLDTILQRVRELLADVAIRPGVLRAAEPRKELTR